MFTTLRRSIVEFRPMGNGKWNRIQNTGWHHYIWIMKSLAVCDKRAIQFEHISITRNPLARLKWVFALYNLPCVIYLIKGNSPITCICNVCEMPQIIFRCSNVFQSRDLCSHSTNASFPLLGLRVANLLPLATHRKVANHSPRNKTHLPVINNLKQEYLEWKYPYAIQ
jgi:hypothetical protein